MKTLLIALTVLSLSGCAGLSAWVTTNQVAIGQVALVAGAVAAVESAGANALQIKNELDSGGK